MLAVIPVGRDITLRAGEDHQHLARAIKDATDRIGAGQMKTESAPWAMVLVQHSRHMGGLQTAVYVRDQNSQCMGLDQIVDRLMIALPEVLRNIHMRTPR